MAIKDIHPSYGNMEPLWKRCRDTISGGDAVKAAGESYLPKLLLQKDPEYKAYKLRALFWNASYRTVAAFSGMMLRKDPVITIPKPVEEYLGDITMSGIPVQTFIQKVIYECLSVGRVGLLVDFPSIEATEMSRAETEALNLRPTIQIYKTESIYNWKTAWVNNRTMLTEVRLLENAELEIQDEFDTPKTETRYRILDISTGIYRSRVFRWDKKTSRYEQVGKDNYPVMNGKNMNYIPFYFIGVDDISPEPDIPPLIDLVDVNLAHYRLDADYKNALHFTGFPQPCTAGFDKPTEGDGMLYIGSSQAWMADDPAAKAWYLEYGGDLGAAVSALDRLEQQMAILGARLLVAEKKATETSQTAEIHRAGEMSILSSMANTLSHGLTLTFKTFVEWAGADNAKVDVQINKDFVANALTPEKLTALMMAWQVGGISKETLFYNLMGGDMYPEELTFEEEQARIGSEGPNPPDSGTGV